MCILLFNNTKHPHLAGKVRPQERPRQSIYSLSSLHTNSLQQIQGDACR